MMLHNFLNSDAKLENNLFKGLGMRELTTQKKFAYTAKLPWKQEYEPLPNKYLIFKKHTQSMVKHLSQTPNLFEHYTVKIRI